MSKEKQENQSIHVTTYTDLAAWRQAQGPLAELISAAPMGSGIHYTDWAVSAMSPVYLKPTERIHFSVAWQGPTPVALFPLVVEQKSILKGGVRRARFWGDVPGSSRLEGHQLVNPKFAGDLGTQLRATKAVWNHLLHNSDRNGRIDTIDLQYQTRTDPLMRSAIATGHPHQISACDMKGFVIDLPESFDQYLAGMPGRTRREFKKIANKAQASGLQVSHEKVLTPQQWSAIEDLHSRRQADHMADGSSRTMTFRDPKLSRATREFYVQAQIRGLARYTLVSDKDKLVAFVVGHSMGHGAVMRTTAFDMDYKALQPGRLACLSFVESCIHDRLSGVDMMLGHTHTKADLATREVPYLGAVVDNDRATSKLRMAMWGLVRRDKPEAGAAPALLPAQVAASTPTSVHEQSHVHAEVDDSEDNSPADMPRPGMRG